MYAEIPRYIFGPPFSSKNKQSIATVFKYYCKLWGFIYSASDRLALRKVLQQLWLYEPYIYKILMQALRSFAQHLIIMNF
jgi:hypothetical protein